MLRAHIDISRDLEGEPVVHACFDLAEREVAAAAHAVKTVAEERFRMSDMSADDVLELREMTALADELASGLPVADPEGGAWAEGGARADGGARAEGGVRADGGGARADGGARAGGGARAADGFPAQDLDGGLLGDDPDGPMRTIVMRPARLTVFREAAAQFVESRDEAEWIRHEDREPLAILRGMLFGLEQLCAEALRAALSPGTYAH
jgi:hypothetical protein